MPVSKAVQQDDGERELGFDAPAEADATIVTSADPLRSLLELPQALVEECRVHLEDDGLKIRAVDPANVGLVSLSVPASSFETYAVAGSLTIGLPLDTLAKSVRFARKRQDDPVRVDVLPEGERARLRAAALRPNQRMRRVSEFYTINPDSVREEPDVPDIELPNMAAPDVNALGDAIAELERLNEHVWFSRDGETFLISTQPVGESQLDEDHAVVDSVAFPEAAWSENGADSARGSVFSMDYLSDAIGALDAAKADRVTLSFGDEFPTRIRGEWVEWGFTATFMVAPRIESESQ